MKRNTLLKAALGATMICSIASTTVLASPDHDHGAKTTKAAVKHDAKAIKILERSIEASGGREFIETATSVHTTGTIEIPMAGLSGTMEIFAAEGGNLLIKTNIPGFGEQLQGLHKGIGWSMEPMGGPKLLEEEMVVELEDQSNIKATLNYKDRYSTITFVGEMEFNEQAVNQIDYISNATGKESTEYYSIETGLLAGSIVTVTTEMGEMKATTTINEYAEYGGAMMPSKSTQSVGPMSFHTTIDSAEFNKVDMSTFEFPQAIKALIEASKEDDAMDD